MVKSEVLSRKKMVSMTHSARQAETHTPEARVIVFKCDNLVCDAEVSGRADACARIQDDL